jgi:hypothetical protein
MKIYRPQKNAGYVAIITVLVLCSVLSALLFSSGTRALLMRISLGQNEDKIKSRILADSCSYIALSSYIQNTNYSPINQSVALDSQTSCVINKIKVQNAQLIIDVTGVSGKSITQMEAIDRITENTIIPSTWKEIIPN